MAYHLVNGEILVNGEKKVLGEKIYKVRLVTVGNHDYLKVLAEDDEGKAKVFLVGEDKIVFINSGESEVVEELFELIREIEVGWWPFKRKETFAQRETGDRPFLKVKEVRLRRDVGGIR